MGVLAEAAPQPPDGFEQTDDTAQAAELAQSPPRGALYVDVYLQRVDLFQRELSQALEIASSDPNAISESSYPVVKVIFNPELEAEPFAIDDDLYTGLFDVYTLCGWHGIAAIEAALRAAAPGPEGDRAGGVDASAWQPAAKFFRFTRNLLGLMIRDQLSDMETQLALQTITQLSVASDAVSEAWSRDFNFKEKYLRTVHKNFKGESWDYDIYGYRALNVGLSTQLYTYLTQSVEARVKFEQTQQDLALIRDQIQQTRNQMDMPSPSATSSQDQLAQLYTDQTRLTALEQSADAFRQQLQKQIAATTPLGLLIVDRLKQNFSQETMEQTLADVLFQLFGQLDDLGGKIDPGVNHVNLLVPGLPPNALITMSAIDGWNCPTQGPEAFVIKAAMGALADKPEYAPMLAAPTLDKLVASGSIETDSFAYVVAFQYQSVLQEALARQAADDRAGIVFWQMFAKISAGLSLAALATPVTAEAFPLLRGASALADLIVLAHTVRSVTATLAKYDQLLQSELLDPDAFAFEHLARMGALGAYRDRLLSQFPLQLLQELVLVAAGARWAAVAETLKWRAYLTDIEILLDTGDEENG